MSTFLENLLALSGTLSLAIGAIFLVSSLMLLFIGIVIKEPIQKQKTFKLLKKTLLLTAILLLVGTGICALQFNSFQEELSIVKRDLFK